MIKVNVMYPSCSKGQFDIDYYCTRHIPMLTELLGKCLKATEVEAGVAGGSPGETPLFVAVGHLTFESVDSFRKCFGPNAKKIFSDMENFTNIEPHVQISEIKV
jgi:uncharacterized protein (TIGR02118 family)